MKESIFDVAISVAEQDCSYAEAVAGHLRSKGITLFYYKSEEHTSWGKDLKNYLPKLYTKQAKYILLFLSKKYFHNEWTLLELDAIQRNAMPTGKEHILPIRLDDCSLPEFLSTTAFVDLRTKTPAEVAVLVLQKLGYSEFTSLLSG
ncbi:MAG: TIR domain-containing protein [Solidesulfovibrio sp. DCME]|uniref:TIR domain-containing protein n=1 Tax=Solidesulfovibrio sp. DCME TaxID=3447380 RepID=UPI003D1000AF